MNRAVSMLTVVTLVGIAIASSVSRRGEAQNVSAGLPGARAVIEAAKYPSIQAALDALPKEGGVVRLPPGTFEISSPLVLSTEDVLLEGCGGATHIKNVNASGEPALIIRAKQPTPAPRQPVRLWRIHLANFRITGNEKSGHGIHAEGINEIFIHGVTCSYHGKDGFHFDDCYEDPRVCNSLITYNKGTGLHLNACHDIVVSGNQFEENFDALKCLDSFNLCMTGNNLDDHLGAGVIIENTYGSVVSGNMIEECNGTAIILDRDCYGITLSANVIAHNGGGIDLRDAHGCAVSANTFTINLKDGLRIGPASGRIAVTGNNFANSFIGVTQSKRLGDEDRASGIILEGTTDVTISGNVLAGVRPKALSTGEAASRRIIFANNVVADAESDQAKLQESLVTDNINAK